MTNTTEPANRLALAIGDPNGIGPEIAIKALAALAPARRRFITLYGPAAVIESTAGQLELGPVLEAVRIVDVGRMPAHAFEPGRIAAEAGASAIASASAAIEACRRQEVAAVVACPHHETAVHQAGIDFSGYPSLVARVCRVPEDSVFLLLVGGGLRIVHATLHESVQQALDRLSPELVVAAVRAGLRACALLGVEQPATALFGINPHASEGGLFGPHDARVTIPAAERLRAEGLPVDGPAGADVLLSERRHDLYCAMLHDQGHIPVKLLAPRAASALSVGAEALLSSVGHGSAMDIAGLGRADASALVRTIDLLSGRAAPGAHR
jgi:1,2-dihydroxy-3,5-cyclohexadiene-1,4-dicarboxylate dehydrogenase